MHPEGKMSSRKVNIYTSPLVGSQFLLLVMMLTQRTVTTADHIFYNYNIFSKKHRSIKVSNMLCALFVHSAGIYCPLKDKPSVFFC